VVIGDFVQSSACHSLTKETLRVLAVKLVKYRNCRLQQVPGAFKVTPIRQLETEAYDKPPDLWPSDRIVRFQVRLEGTGLARQIKDACAATRAQLRIRTRGKHQQQEVNTLGTARRQWVEQWIRQLIEQWDVQEKQRVLQDWTDRQANEQREAERIERPGTGPSVARLFQKTHHQTKGC
jgi:hypothetical protein